MKKLSVIICAKNIGTSIYSTLISIENFRLFSSIACEVIVVDKGSDGAILDRIKRFNDTTLLKQDKDGLANARNLGVKHAKGDYILMLGADNLFPSKMEEAIVALIRLGWVGLGFLTKCDERTYLEKQLSKWWEKKNDFGECRVVGTPILYKAEILKKYMYNENCTHSDDTELGDRLYNDGHVQGYSKFKAYDISTCNLSALNERWTRYGISDYEYYKNNYRKWGFRRKIQSMLHPIKTEWIPDLAYFPFFLLIVFLRYKGWIKSIFKRVK